MNEYNFTELYDKLFQKEITAEMVINALSEIEKESESEKESA